MTTTTDTQYLAIAPLATWARAEFPHPLLTVDYDAEDHVIGVALAGPLVIPPVWIAEKDVDVSGGVSHHDVVIRDRGVAESAQAEGWRVTEFIPTGEIK